MRTVSFIFALSASLLWAEPFPEMPLDGVEKTKGWEILLQQWRSIEPQLFTPAGRKYIGRTVRFDSAPVTIGKPLVVRTKAGTVARVWSVPKDDMDLVRQFRKPPSNITVEGILTAIDPSKHMITITAFEIRPTK